MDLVKPKLQPTLVSNPHPLLGGGREYHYAAFKDGETLADYCARNNVAVPRANLALYVNGERILCDWANYIPKHGEAITLRSVAEGGGARKVFSIVAMIALAVVAPYAAGAMGFTAGSFGYAAVSGAIMIGGSLLISAVLPPIMPAQMGVKDKEQSPTYGISAGRNQMNAYGPMAVVFGKHKLVPYFASKPYTTFVGDDQYLSQAFHLGLQPGIDISQIKIGQTLIGNFREVEIERSLADGRLSLVSGNVDTIEGLEFTKEDGWTVRTSPEATEFIDVDLTANLYNIADDGDEEQEQVEVEAQYRKQGDSAWLPLGGSYSTRATHYWSLGYYTTEYLGDGTQGDRTRKVWNQVRYGSIDPSEHTAGETEQVLVSTGRDPIYGFRKDEYKTATWRWLPYPPEPFAWVGSRPNPAINLSGTGVQLLKGSSPQKPARATMTVSVERGIYDVRVRKITNDINTSRRSNKTAVAQIRFTQADDADYSGQDRLAVRIKATSQLSGAIEELSVIASAKCLVWKGSAWQEEETSNPAWWYLHWALGRFDNNGHRVYGEGLPMSRIDVDGIRAWAAFCDAKNLTFNWVLDRKMSIEDVYYTIARAGRAGVTWQTGKRGVVFDSADIPTTTMVTPANILAGSYEYTYINSKVADEIIINFFNKDRDYAADSVRQKVPGTLDTNNPITLDLEGCTDVDMAGREANLTAASQLYHCKQHKWEQDIEGVLAVRGDVVEMTHDLNSWGASGRLVDADGKKLVLDSYVQGRANGWLSLRDTKNKIAYLRSNGVGVTDGLTVIGNWPTGFTPPTTENAHDYLWQYSPTETPGKKLHIKSVKPKAGPTFTFEAIEYLPEYYAAEHGDFEHLEKPSSEYGYSPISVMEIMAYEKDVNEITENTTVVISWLLSEPAVSNVTVTSNGQRHSQFNNVYGNQVEILAKTGDELVIDVTPFKAGRASESLTYNYVVAGTNELIPTPTGLEIVGDFTASSVRIKWDRVKSAVNYEVEVASSGSVRRTVKVGDALTYTYSAADMKQDGGQVRTLTFRVRALGKGSSRSAWVEVTASNPQIAQLQDIQIINGVKSIIASFAKPEDDDLAGYLFWLSDDQNFTPTVNNVHFDGDFNQYFFERFNGEKLEAKDYYVWVAGYDTFGKDELNISPRFTAKPVLIDLSPESITEEMIANGAFTKTKFAENIKVPIVVSVMPTEAKENDQVILESTGKLYRYKNGVWKPQIMEAPDLEGLLSEIHFDTEVNARLDLIDGDGAGSVKQQIQEAQAELDVEIDTVRESIETTKTDLETVISDNKIEANDAINSAKSKFESAVTDLESADTVLEQNHSKLAVRVGSAEGSISTLETTVASNNNAITKSLNEHVSEYNDNKTNVQNQITTLTNGQTSFADSMSQLTSQVGDNYSETSQALTTLADNQSAVAQRTGILEAKVIDGENILPDPYFYDPDKWVKTVRITSLNQSDPSFIVDKSITNNPFPKTGLLQVSGLNPAQYFGEFGAYYYPERGATYILTGKVYRHTTNAKGSFDIRAVFLFEDSTTSIPYLVNLGNLNKENVTDFKLRITVPATNSNGSPLKDASVRIRFGCDANGEFYINNLGLVNLRLERETEQDKEIYARINSVDTAYKSADAALASSITSMGASFDNSMAAFEDEIDAVATTAQSAVTHSNTLRTQLVGGYTGTNPNQVSTGLVKNLTTAINDVETNLAQQISSLEVGMGEQFDYSKIWHFNRDTEGWTGVWEDGWLASGGVRTYIESPNNLNIDGDSNNLVKLRIKKIGNPEWRGILRWQTVSDPTCNASKQIIAPEPVWSDSGVATIDIGDILASGETIKRIVLYTVFTASLTDYYSVDWFAIGRPSPGASTAQVESVRQAALTATNAVADDVTALTTRMGSAESAINTTNTTVANNQQASTTALNNHISAYNSNKTSVQNQITTINNNQGSLANQIDKVEAETGDVRAGLDAEITARTTADNALVMSNSRMEARLSGDNCIEDPYGIDQSKWGGAVTALNPRSIKPTTESELLLTSKPYVMLNAINLTGGTPNGHGSEVRVLMDVEPEREYRFTGKFNRWVTNAKGSYNIRYICRYLDGSNHIFNLSPQINLRQRNTDLFDYTFTPRGAHSSTGSPFSYAEVFIRFQLDENGEAYAASPKLLEWRVERISNTVKDVQSSVTSLENVVATDRQTAATATTQLESRMNTKIAEVDTKAETWVDDLNDKVGALVTLDLNVNGLSGGFRIQNTGDTVAAGFDVDHFYLGRGSNSYRPFYQEGSNTFIDNASIKNLQAGNLGANSVTAGKIAAGAIGADQIAAGAITANKLTVTDFQNCIVDPFFSDPTQWSGGVKAFVNQSASTFVPTKTMTSNPFPRAGGFGHDGGTAGAYGNELRTFVKLDRGKEYLFTGKVYRCISNAKGGYQIYARFIYQDGTAQTQLLQSGISFSARNVDEISATFTAREAHTTSGSPLVNAEVYIRIYRDGNGDYYVNQLSLVDWSVRKMDAGELIVDGSILARHVKAGEITANEIKVNSLTGDRMAANFLQARHFSANLVQAGHIDVVNLAAINSNLGVITGGSLNINNRFTVASDGTVAIKNASGGTVFSSGSGMNVSNITGLGVLATAPKLTSSNISTYINNAAIRTAQIGDLQVDTLKIANNAVTVTMYSTASTFTLNLANAAEIIVLKYGKSVSGRRGSVYNNIVSINISGTNLTSSGGMHHVGIEYDSNDNKHDVYYADAGFINRRITKKAGAHTVTQSITDRYGNTTGGAVTLLITYK